MRLWQRTTVWAAVALLGCAGWITGAAAQPGGPAAARGSAGVPTSALPPVLADVGFDQRLDAAVPLDLPFRDETGRAVMLGDYFGDKPVVLALVYYDCPMLCSQLLNGLAGSLRGMSLEAGRDFTVVAVSFDPTETPEMAAPRKQAMLERYGHPGSGEAWHLLTGNDPSIRALTEAIGFRYTRDPATGEFAHPAGVTILTPRGVVARYLFGLEYAPRDLRLALVEAAANRIGSPVDQLLLYCYLYDPASGKYGLMTMRVLRLAGVATVLAIGGFILIMWRHERRGSA